MANEMNRRDALRALGALASATGMQIAPVTTREADGLEVVIIKSSQRLSTHSAECLRELWKRGVEGTSLADVKTVVLDQGIDVELVRTRSGDGR